MGGRRRSGRNLSWICVTKGLAYFVRLRWWRRWGGSWTFVLKVLDMLRRKRRKVSCCVLVPFACCITPGVGSQGPETLVPPLGGGTLGPSRSCLLSSVPGRTYGWPNRGWIRSGGGSHGPRYLIEGIHELDYFARGRNKVGGAN